jgi:fibronectin-binding autotransporter adhesin
VGAVSVGLNATVEVGGSLNLVTNVLTLSGALTNNGGTINGIGAQAFVAQSIVHNGGITNLMGVTTNSVHTVTVNATGLTLPTGLILIDNLFTSNVDFTMPGSVATITGNIAVTGGTLTLTATNPSITGTITTDGSGSISGSTGGTTITSGTLPTPPSPCPNGQHLTGSAGAYTCVLTPIIIPIGISAPIFSTEEKAKIFIEEVI